MFDPSLVELAEVGKDAIQTTHRGVRQILDEEERRDAAIETFLRCLMPHARGFPTLVMTWRGEGEEDEPVNVGADQNAAAVLTKHMNDMLRSAGQVVTSIRDPRMRLRDLTGYPSNVSLFGGPCANPVCCAALGFIDRSHDNELYLDDDCPLWERGMLKYYSICSYREKSPGHARQAFESFLEKTGVPNFQTAGLIWGIAQPGLTWPRIETTDDEWTLLITRIINFFLEESADPVPTQGLTIIDGVHGQATQAFRMLFDRAHVSLLEKINKVVKGRKVFQIPLIVQMNTNKEAIGLRLDEDRCPIHVWTKDDQGLRRAVHQYTIHRLSDLIQRV